MSNNTIPRSRMVALPVLFSIAFIPLAKAAESQPIRSVTVGGGSIYAASTGDEWSPTWAESGDLYTNNDDRTGVRPTLDIRRWRAGVANG